MPQTDPHSPSDPRELGPHVDPDRLTLIALGESALSDTESAHVSGCVHCGDDLASLSAVAMLGRDVPAAPEVPADAWDAIVAGGTAPLNPADAAGLADTGVPAQPVASSQSAPPAVVPPARPVRADRFRRVAMVAAAAIVGVAFGAGVMAGVHSISAPAPAPPTSGLASASLAPQAAAAAGASGSAQLLLVGGQQVLRVRVAGMPRAAGFYEVWLFDPAAGKMVALGTLGSSDSVELPVPSGVDPHAYQVVDVSAQLVNGDPAHGQSMLRGALR